MQKNPMRRINSSIMKENNRRIILDLIRKQRFLSRKEIAEITGLTSATITNLVKELLEEGYIVEGERGESSGGPRPILLTINGAWGYFIGIELIATEIICVLTDFNAHILEELSLPVDVSQGSDRVIKEIVSCIERIISESGLPRQKFKGVGIVSAGPVDILQGVMLRPPNFPGWENIPIRKYIEECIQIPVHFDKETVATAFGESYFGDAKEAQLLFVSNVFKIGIGGGMLSNGKIFRGFQNNASNIGHTQVVFHNGAICSCGRTGCLETVADGKSAVQSLQNAYQKNPKEFKEADVTSLEDLTYEFLVRSAEDGFLPSRNAIIQAAEYMGMALLNVIMLVSPDTVVITGELVDDSQLFAETCIRYVDSLKGEEHKNVRVYRSKVGKNITSLGIVAIMLEEHV